MDENDRKLISKLFTLGCGTGVSLYAMYLGYDGHLALVAVVALFGGEKMLEKLLSK